MTLPRVTVLMAVRDGAAHLEAQLHSIAAQRGVDWRLVASDDGSGDDSPAILARFAAAHPGRVRLMQGPRQGTTANFLALLAATGADDGWLAFSDQDDIWLPDKLARATAAMKAAEVGLWTAQVTLCDESGRVLGSGADHARTARLWPAGGRGAGRRQYHGPDAAGRRPAAPRAGDHAGGSAARGLP
jgi:glycosyltransferase involved in cell wall biosynthesis